MNYMYFLEEIPWLWRYRQQAAQNIDYTIDDLTSVDIRLDALFEALFFHRDKALEWCSENIDGSDVGEVAMYACLLGYHGKYQALVEFAGVVNGQNTLGAWIDGLKWLPAEYLGPIKDYFLGSQDGFARALGYNLLNSEDNLDAHVIGAALTERDFLTVMGATRYVILNRDSYFEPLLQSQINRSVGDVYFLVIKALLLLGGGTQIQRMIDDREWGESDGPLMILLSHALPSVMSNILNKRVFSSGLTAPWLEALGVLGSPESIPRIIPYIDQFPLESATAIQSISGFDIRTLGGRSVPVSGEGVEEDAGNDTIAIDVDAVVKWWDSARARLMKCPRLFWGAPFGDEVLLQGLKKGNQKQRASAALYLALGNRDFPYIDVYEHGLGQQPMLKKLEVRLEKNHAKPAQYAGRKIG